MKIFIALVFAALTSFAFASPGNHGCVGNCGTNGGGSGDIKNTNNIGVSNRISNDVRNKATSFAGAQSSSNSGGNVTTLTVNEAAIPADTTQAITYGGKYEVKGVPNVFSGNVYPTTNCAHSTQVGGSGVGFGFTVGTSYLDEECSLRETSRSFAGMGLKEDALHVLCSSKFSVAAPSCKAIAAPKE